MGRRRHPTLEEANVIAVEEIERRKSDKMKGREGIKKSRKNGRDGSTVQEDKRNKTR